MRRAGPGSENFTGSFLLRNMHPKIRGGGRDKRARSEQVGLSPGKLPKSRAAAYGTLSIAVQGSRTKDGTPPNPATPTQNPLPVS